MIVMFSSFLSPHMKPLCDEIYKLCNKQFIYVECTSLSEERKRMGYAFGEKIEYLKNMTGDLQGQIELANSADCVIINTGSASIDIVRQRVLQKKLTFYMSERIFKRGVLKLLDPKLWKMILFNIKNKNQNSYLLCLGKYVKKDFERIFFPKNRSFKFGYFPKIEAYRKQPKADDTKRFVWVARTIDWKRPFFAVDVIKRLNNKGVKCSLKMLGDGKLFEKVKQYVERKNLTNVIELLGNVDNKTVREYMAQSDYLLHTSNKREGWGAVANEALSSGIPVVASNSIGCVDYLIRDGFNGVVFKTYSKNDAAKKIMAVSNEKYEILQDNTEKTLNEWNEQVAAKRFITVLQNIYDNAPLTEYENGPMSRA